MIFRNKKENTFVHFYDCYFIWYKNNLEHRTKGPACGWEDGQLEWRQNDKLHREDGPAYIGCDGDKEWFQYGISLGFKDPKDLK